MKEMLKELPQIDAQFEFYEKGSVESVAYANKLLNTLLRFYTLHQISSHTGIGVRLLSYMRHRGVNTYPNQIALEIMAGAKVIVER